MGDLDVTWARRIEDLERLVAKANEAIKDLRKDNMHLKSQLEEVNKKLEQEP